MESLVFPAFRPRLLFVFAFPLLWLPLSLPLSVLVGVGFVDAPSMGLSLLRFGVGSLDVVMSAGSLVVPIAGVAGRLLSCTVSSVDPVPLTPRPGVRIPERGVVSSLSTSVVLAETSVKVVDEGEARSITSLGVLTPWSDLRGERTDGLVEAADGGGDFSLSDVGQRGGLFPDAPLL